MAKGTPLYFAGVVSAAAAPAAAAASGAASNGSALFSAAAAAGAPPSFSSASRLPHSTFGLRAIDETRFSIVDDATGALLEEMEASKAFFVV